MDRHGHRRDPELTRTVVEPSADPAGGFSWRVTSIVNPARDDPPGTSTRYTQTGPHTIDAVTALLRAVQDHPEPMGRDAAKAPDDLITSAFHEWIGGAATRLADARRAIDNGDPPDYEVPELVDDIVNGADRYAAWRRDVEDDMTRDA